MASHDRDTIRLADPDPLGLVDVIELIAPEARVTGWQPLAGGVANAMHAIEVTMPSGAKTSFVLRRAIPETGHPTDLLHEARTLELLRPTPVPAPEVLWLDGDGVVFGRPAMAMTRLPGRVRTIEVADDPAVVRGLAEALVTLQWVVDLTPFEHLDHRPDAASLLVDVDPATARAAPPYAAAVRDELAGAVPSLGPLTMSLCHGDFHVGNVLLDAGRPAGIVDWDHARISDARCDLAYAAMDLAIVAGGEVADAFVAEYEALRGPVEDLHWWCLWATTRTWHGLASWLPGWTEIGVDVDLAVADARLAAWTAHHRRALTSG